MEDPTNGTHSHDRGATVDSVGTVFGVAPKRVVFTMAGKGGVGKTTLLVALAEWYAENGLNARLLDMDPDNKAEGSLFSFFPDRTKRLDMSDDNAYDALAGISLDSDADIILADMGGSQGYKAIPWFRDFYQSMQNSGLPIRWTAVGVVTTDIASARTVLEWARELGDSVDYLIVHNYFVQDRAYRSCFDDPFLQEAVSLFREDCQPLEIRMDNRRSDMQDLMRKHCLTLGRVMKRSEATVPALRSPDVVFRARTYRFRLFEAFLEAGKALLP